MEPGPASVFACDIGWAIALPALMMEHAQHTDLTFFDAASGKALQHGLFGLIREHHDVFRRLSAYARQALVTAHLGNGTYKGYRPGVLETYLSP